MTLHELCESIDWWLIRFLIYLHCWRIELNVLNCYRYKYYYRIQHKHKPMILIPDSDSDTLSNSGTRKKKTLIESEDES